MFKHFLKRYPYTLAYVVLLGVLLVHGWAFKDTFPESIFLDLLMLIIASWMGWKAVGEWLEV